MNWLVYLLQVNLALICSWILYYAALKRLTFFQWNRYYLLGSIMLSFLLPLLKLQFIHSMEGAVEIKGINWDYVDYLVTHPVAVR